MTPGHQHSAWRMSWTPSSALFAGAVGLSTVDYTVGWVARGLEGLDVRTLTVLQSLRKTVQQPLEARHIIPGPVSFLPSCKLR